jgi:hypothetical protein
MLIASVTSPSRLALLLVASLPVVAASQVLHQPERFTAFAINMTNRNPGTNARLEIVVDRWSTEADREALAVVYDENGTPGLYKALHDAPRQGFVRVSNRLGYDLSFARQVSHWDGSRRVSIVMARRLTVSEGVGSSPTGDYPLTVIELQLKADGTGEGTMSVGVQVRIHKHDDFMEVDKYGAGTVLLKDVKPATDSDR